MGILAAACGIQFHEQGSNPGPPYWERSVLATGPLEKSPYGLFLDGPGMPSDVFGSGLVSQTYHKSVLSLPRPHLFPPCLQACLRSSRPSGFPCGEPERLLLAKQFRSCVSNYLLFMANSSDFPIWAGTYNFLLQ